MKPNVMQKLDGMNIIIMQKLDGMNIIIQRKVQNHQNTFKETSTTVSHGLPFQMLQKMPRPGRT